MDEQQEMRDLIIERDALLQDRRRLIAALEAIKDLPDTADFLSAWSIAVAALRGDDTNETLTDVMLNAEADS